MRETSAVSRSMVRTLDAAIERANGSGAPVLPSVVTSLPPAPPVLPSDAQVMVNAKAFHYATSGCTLRTANAMGRPEGDIRKMCYGELPSPATQCVRSVVAIVLDGKSWRVALSDLNEAFRPYGFEVAPVGAYDPERDIATKVTRSPAARVRAYQALLAFTDAISEDHALLEFPKAKRGKRRTESV